MACLNPVQTYLEHHPVLMWSFIGIYPFLVYGVVRLVDAVFFRGWTR